MPGFSSASRRRLDGDATSSTKSGALPSSHGTYDLRCRFATPNATYTSGAIGGLRGFW